MLPPVPERDTPPLQPTASHVQQTQAQSVGSLEWGVGAGERVVSCVQQETATL